MTRIYLTLLLACWWQMASAQNITDCWQDVAENDLLLPRESARNVQATQYRALALDLDQLKTQLRQAPLEFTRNAERRPLLIALPLPAGGQEVFAVVESPIMEPELAARYPNVKTYKGQGVHNRFMNLRFDLSERGFYATINTLRGQIYIDPLASGQTRYYQAYYTRDALQEPTELSCGVPTPAAEAQTPDLHEFSSDAPLLSPRSNQTLNLQTYRMGVATTGEFARRFGATTREQVMAVVVNVINRANTVLERDVAIRLVLANNSDVMFFLDPETDPFTNGTNAGSVLGQIRAVLNANIGVNGYDIGHALSSSCTGGTAGVVSGLVCNNDNKGAGVSCINNVNISSIEVFAHEVGHQFSASHTWSNCPGNETQLASASAFEPGSGNTIMSYAGVCGGGQNVQNSSDDYFHNRSLEQMTLFSRVGLGANCAAIVPTDNVPPEVTLPYSNNFYIPISTPFELTATATDANGDELTYCWEQYDLGPNSSLGSPTGDAPAFRSFRPTNSPTRVFPRLQNIINNTSSNAEVLPTYDRTLTFRCTVRDNFPGSGAAVWRQVRFLSTSSAGPFLVTHPNEDTVQWTAGTYTEVRWDVARTNNNLVNCRAVNIRLSLDGGLTYPFLLAESVPNNGTARVPVPDVASSQARVRVEAADNIFFDISNQNFQILPAAVPDYTLNVAPGLVRGHCLPEPLEFTINSAAFLGFAAPISLEIIDSLPDEIETSLSSTTLQPGESTTLRVRFNTQLDGTFHLQVRGTADGGQTVSLPVSFSTVSNDFSSLQMLSPADGTAGIILSSTFSWNKVSEGALYAFELATSPAFGATVIASAAELTDTSFTPSIFLKDNELYFWRIRPFNRQCSSVGEWLEPFTLHTATVSCDATPSTNVPINISGSGLPTVNSTLVVTRQGVISDVNIPLIRANYQPVNSLRVSLISPAGTEVVLFNQNCGATLRFEVGFDDESPSAITCPPDSRMVVRPVEPLARFIGENTAGTWTLRTQVVRPGFGGGGGIESWGVEFCSTFSPNNPFIVTNDTLRVPPALTNTITINELEARDIDNSPDELVFTLVSLPAHGTLRLNNAVLQIGAQFSQTDINAFRLQYTHNGDPSLTDGFTFVVQDGTGGFLPTQRFAIQIDENATVSTNKVLIINNVHIFPNPARDLLNLRFDQAPKGNLWISLYNVQGQELLGRRFEQADDVLQIPTAGLPGGMYFLTLRSEGHTLTRKVSIQR
ncbi:MAG TPA: M12 family metallo-peptidase [Saprospiraceae bacterium]|nr:M12 family metallo-peptidase [Saprospiraceae bacterium]HMP24743.1 M12 family metallo-peptidase [Saprospiraceae bacterium]